MKNLMMSCALLLLQSFVYSQSINSIRTDQDCLNFVKKILANPLFEFDTSFARPFFTDQLSGNHHKYWGIADLNADGKPDLYFTGKTKAHAGYMNNADAFAYLSNNDGKYELVNLITGSNACCNTPMITFRKKVTANILCVYICSDYGVIDRDTILIKAGKYPDYVKWVDSIVFRNNIPVNYYSNPSKVKFDSLEYHFRSGWYDSDFILSIYKSGECALKLKDGEFFQMNLAPEKLNFIQELIYSMDFISIRKNFSLYATDQSYAILKVFAGNKTYVTTDYGMQSNFTLMAAYKLFDEIEQSMNHY